jgi:hypothetical protein
MAPRVPHTPLTPTPMPNKPIVPLIPLTPLTPTPTFTPGFPLPPTMQSSSSDPFVVRMVVDERGDGDTNPSTPKRSTNPSTQPRVSVPESTVQSVVKWLKRIIQPDDEDEDIKDSLAKVWITVNDALEAHVKGKRLATRDEFFTNVKERGENVFIKVLRDAVKNNTWQDLLDNGTSFLPPNLKQLVTFCP